MTRTQRIIAAIDAEIMRHQAELDADDQLRRITITLKLNQGGFPRAVWLDREQFTDLQEPVKGTLNG